ncbi:uncharacterized protein LOC131076096 isoform X2 [Cryptomeria japonica]|uniref:uncharacterized protein LOC131076096 isoform X2 n=1 Tax=Cryptomeria japonica TaxID=3369 RepID=UPI0027DA6513|nr:uncharacterized protein LOC131076096 isoform X2 [Cryptomeria japonica]
MCQKETQLYCCTHKVPVCGDCICFPEHSACEVRTYAEWMVDSSCSFLPKCSFCYDPHLELVTHVLHTNHRNIVEDCRLLCLNTVEFCKRYRNAGVAYKKLFEILFSYTLLRWNFQKR